MSLPKKLIMLAMSMCFFNTAFGMEKDNEANDGLSYIPQAYTKVALKSVTEASSATHLAIGGVKKIMVGASLCSLPVYYYYSSGMDETANKLYKCSSSVDSFRSNVYNVNSMRFYTTSIDFSKDCSSLTRDLSSMEEQAFTLFTCALPGSIILGSGLFDLGNAGFQLGKSLLRKLWLGAAISQDMVIKED